MIRTGQAASAAGTASMIAVEGNGALPAGTYRPTASIGWLIRSQRLADLFLGLREFLPGHTQGLELHAIVLPREFEQRGVSVAAHPCDDRVGLAV